MNKTFFLRTQDVKRNCLGFIANLPTDEDTPLVVKVSEITRNLEQNALMWPLLECFSQQVRWPVNGNMQYLEPEEWKDLLSAAFKNETQRVAMGMNGGMVILGTRTSKMGKKEFSEFTEFIYATGTRRGVMFDERKVA